MNRTNHTCDIAIIGGGPAGLAAAYCAIRGGGRVMIIDDNHAPGGQIWRGEQIKPTIPEAAAWFERVRSAGVEFIHGARVINQPEVGIVTAETIDGICEIDYRKLILATGARERFLPFPGWTLPNVAGAGGLQALVKSGLPIKGKRIVVAGSGPLLMAVAAYLRKQGAEILLIAEQTDWRRLLRFGLGLMTQSGKIAQAIELKRKLSGVPYLTGCRVVKAEGQERLMSVHLHRGKKKWDEKCDYLACGFNLVPNVELAALLGCEISEGKVVVNDYQETSLPGIFCAGEATGIGGLELSLVEGRIAGLAVADLHDEAASFFAERKKLRSFAQMLDHTFALRDELKSLPSPDTIVCRCEDVTWEHIRSQGGWREAKLQTRCGMGPCQGRICGAAIEFLSGWNVESVRPPVFPARVESLMDAAAVCEHK